MGSVAARMATAFTAVALMVAPAAGKGVPEKTEAELRCTERTIRPPAEDRGAIPLSTPEEGGAAGEIWFEMNCDSSGEWFSGSLFVRNVSVASLTPFLPERAKATGAAMIVAPGGGTVLLSMDREGYRVARWLAERGIAAFVLKYRTVATPAEPRAFLRVLGGITPPYPTGEAPAISADEATAEEAATLADGLAAVRYLRDHPVRFGISRGRIGMIGFSAGAYTAYNVAIKAEDGARPNLVAGIYGSLPGLASSSAPPAFIVAATDDPQVPAVESVRAYMSWQQAGVPAELHLFQSGGHGFGAERRNSSTDQWLGLFDDWLRQNGFSKP